MEEKTAREYSPAFVAHANRSIAGTEQARQMAIKSNAVQAMTRQAKKTFKEVFAELLPEPVMVFDEMSAWLVEHYPEISNIEAITVAMVRRATLGDVAAAVFIRDTIGESPKRQYELEADRDIDIKISVIEQV